MTTLENELLQVTIRKEGAELTRIRQKEHDLDYLWNADPEHWGKHAPVLFPIIGTLKDNSYYYQDKGYSLQRHGFAREMDFSLRQQDERSAVFELLSDEHTRGSYPFDFRLRIRYTLEGARLTNGYEVVNTGAAPMLFSIGGHPAFHVPLQKDLKYSDFFLEFDTAETVTRWPLDEGLIKTHPLPFLEGQKELPLTHELFAGDAIVLKKLRSRYVSLKSRAFRHGLTMRIEEFPYLGIWAPPEAPFVCIEPWQGLADSLHHNQQLEQKEGMVSLEPGAVWARSWDVSFW